jgi:hypothetical protein
MKLSAAVVCVSATLAFAQLTEDVVLPAPTLTKDFRLECDLNPKLAIGAGPGGTLWNWISFTGGRWNATWGNGTIEVCPFLTAAVAR